MYFRRGSFEPLCHEATPPGSQVGRRLRQCILVHWLCSSHSSLAPVAAVTYQHKCRGLKQHKFIILQLRRSEGQNGSHWAKTKVWEGLVLLCGGSGCESVPCLFQCPEATLTPSLLHSFTPSLTAPSIFKATSGLLSFTSHRFDTDFCLPLPHLEDLGGMCGPPRQSRIIPLF